MLDKLNANKMLVAYCKTRDAGLRNALCEHYLYIAQIVARRFAGRGIEYDDLLQVASMALVKALERYDIDKDVQFTSYATPTLVGEVKNYFRDKSRLIRMSRTSAELAKKIESARDALGQKLMRAPTNREIASHIGESLESVEKVLMDGVIASPVYFETFKFDEDDASAPIPIGYVDSSFDEFMERESINKVVKTLSEFEQSVVRKRFYEEMSQRQVGEELGVSQMHISRIERKILSLLKKELEGSY